MTEVLRPARGGFLRPFGCGPFIKEFLLGHGPEGSPKIDPDRGSAIDDIRYAYKSALLRAYAEDMVAMAMEKGIELSVEGALERIPHRLTKMRSHSFYRYFHHLKMLGWVEATGEEEESAMGRFKPFMATLGRFAALKRQDTDAQGAYLGQKGKRQKKQMEGISSACLTILPFVQ